MLLTIKLSGNNTDHRLLNETNKTEHEKTLLHFSVTDHTFTIARSRIKIGKKSLFNRGLYILNDDLFI